MMHFYGLNNPTVFKLVKNSTLTNYNSKILALNASVIIIYCNIHSNNVKHNIHGAL